MLAFLSLLSVEVTGVNLQPLTHNFYYIIKGPQFGGPHDTSLPQTHYHLPDPWFPI